MFHVVFVHQTCKARCFYGGWSLMDILFLMAVMGFKQRVAWDGRGLKM